MMADTQQQGRQGENDSRPAPAIWVKLATDTLFRNQQRAPAPVLMRIRGVWGDGGFTLDVPDTLNVEGGDRPWGHVPEGLGYGVDENVFTIMPGVKFEIVMVCGHCGQYPSLDGDYLCRTCREAHVDVGGRVDVDDAV